MQAHGGDKETDTPSARAHTGRGEEKRKKRERKPLLFDRVSLFQISATTGLPSDVNRDASGFGIRVTYAS